MIFYFSGTGNSLWVALQLAQRWQAPLEDMAKAIQQNRTSYTLPANEVLAFVFPVHSWGVPPLVRQFVKRLTLEGLAAQPVVAVFTCGDECGHTRSSFVRMLARRGIACRHTYSVQMPNTYICMPKFALDSPELEERKVAHATTSVDCIAKAVETDTPLTLYHQGRFNFLKSKLIYPLFIRFAMDSRPFRNTEGCTRCGLCARRCPTGNINMQADGGGPAWGRRCVQCLACLHHCPAQAIEYGRHTQGKGRYTRFAHVANQQHA